MLVELQAVTLGLLRPPGGDDVQRQAAVRDPVDVGRLLGEQGRLVEVGAHRHHQLQLLGDGGEGGGGGPGVERRLIGPLDVIQVQLGHQGQVVADLFGPLAERLGVGPGRGHPLVGHVAEPAAEDGGPEAVPHAAAFCRVAISPIR